MKQASPSPSDLPSGNIHVGVPLDKWGSRHIISYIQEVLNPNQEQNPDVETIIDELLKQGCVHWQALADLTRKDLDEIFPNKYLIYKTRLLNGIESKKGQPSSSSPLAGNMNIGSLKGNVAHTNNGSQNYTDNTHNSSQDNRSFQVPTSGNLLLSLGAFVAAFTQMSGESGTCSIGGRSVRYQVSGRLHKLKWVYDGKVMDLTTQIQGDSRHYNSRTGALEHALRDLGNQLKERGILTD